MGPYVFGIPYTQNASATGPYLWSNQGQGNQFAIPSSAPGGRVGAAVGQFLMVGDIWQQQQTTLFTGNGSTTSYSGSVIAPINGAGQILDQQGALAGAFVNGNIVGSGYLTSGSINYTSGAISLTFGTAPASGDLVYAVTTLEAPYRVWWSAIGDPTSWPTPLTQSALAAQSGYQDLNTVELGPVMFIAGYPLYALIFQRYGITYAPYQGGSVVFGFAPYESTHGVVAHGAVIQIGRYVFFLSDEGWMFTDGANVMPFGTLPDNSAGIDNWFWANVNQNALEAIRSGYDAAKRCIFFAIPTGTNTLPDTLLTFNILAQKWSKSAVACETIWTTDNGADGSPGTRQSLGLFDQTHTPNTLSGPPLTGYLESRDLYFLDGMRRLVTSVKPHITCTDLPVITVGARNDIQDGVTYGASNYTNAFSREAPALSAGRYIRIRAQSGSATSLHAVTLNLEQDSPL